MKIATMVSRGGLSWDLTDEDALWMARAIVGESTRDAHAITSTMLRRLAYISDSVGRRQWASLSELLLAYSQPIAPKWRDRGTPEQIARRARIRSLQWAEIPAHVRDTVLELFTGSPLSAPGAVHFAAPPVARSFLDSNPGAVRVPGGANHFIAMPGSLGYPDPARHPTPAGLSMLHGGSGSRLLHPIVLGALALLAWWVMA